MSRPATPRKRARDTGLERGSELLQVVARRADVASGAVSLFTVVLNQTVHSLPFSEHRCRVKPEPKRCQARPRANSGLQACSALRDEDGFLLTLSLPDGNQPCSGESDCRSIGVGPSESLDGNPLDLSPAEGIRTADHNLMANSNALVLRIGQYCPPQWTRTMQPGCCNKQRPSQSAPRRSSMRDQFTERWKELFPVEEKFGSLPERAAKR